MWPDQELEDQTEQGQIKPIASVRVVNSEVEVPSYGNNATCLGPISDARKDEEKGKTRKKGRRGRRKNGEKGKTR